jgi:hypothetical protein
MQHRFAGMILTTECALIDIKKTMQAEVKWVAVHARNDVITNIYQKSVHQKWWIFLISIRKNKLLKPIFIFSLPFFGRFLRTLKELEKA